MSVSLCLVASRRPFINCLKFDNLFWVVRFMLICLYLIRSRCLFGISYALYSDCTSSLSDYLYSSYSCHYFPKTEGLMTWHDTFSNVTVMGSTHSLDVPQMLGSRTPPKLPVQHDWSSLPFPWPRVNYVIQGFVSSVMVGIQSTFSHFSSNQPLWSTLILFRLSFPW